MDKDGTERMWSGSEVPKKGVGDLDSRWVGTTGSFVLRAGFIEKYTGIKLTWDDDPYEIDC